MEARRKALETCVYCPKLCRSACPVSNAEPRETLTPWGKMSTAYFAANGDVTVDASFAAPAWACTGCRACREACDHKNDVAGTLYAARSAFVGESVAPKAATRVLEGWDEHRRQTRASVHALAKPSPLRLQRGFLAGCTYTRKLPGESRDALRVVRALHGETSLIDECCGLPLLLAGDAERFRAHARSFAERFDGDTITVLDPGCAVTLRVHYPEHGVKLSAKVGVLVEELSERVTELEAGACADDGLGPVRYHDPCQMGRGLGIYDAPRAILTRVLGAAPLEFHGHGPRAACSGGGGLLPLTMPDVSQEIARRRLGEHADAGGGTVVTACASSLLSFRKQGDKTMDLVSLAARALPRSG